MGSWNLHEVKDPKLATSYKWLWQDLQLPFDKYKFF
jgi:hypothetical protein